VSGLRRRWLIVCWLLLGIAAVVAGAALPVYGQCDPWGSCPIPVGAAADSAAAVSSPSQRDSSWPARARITGASPMHQPGVSVWHPTRPESDPGVYPTEPTETYPALADGPHGWPASHVPTLGAPPEQTPPPGQAAAPSVGAYAFPATIPSPGVDLSSTARTFGSPPGAAPGATQAATAAGALWGHPGSEYYTWQVLPSGLLFKPYLAGGRESRFATRWIYVRGQGWLWDSALGGRVGILRYGTEDPAWPEGWQIDIEGAVFPRLDPEEHRDLVSSDFRFGVPLTRRRGNWEWKFGYYHLSSHLADEFMLKNPRPRINYSRDCLVLGVAWYPWPSLRLYAETEYAFWYDGGARPWGFQFGAEYSPLTYTGMRGAPFWAVNGRLREENDFGGNVTFQTGWQWRGPTGHLLRFGLHYFNGMSDEYQFFREHEDQVGVGFWYDY
jgi:hypothetical protein